MSALLSGDSLLLDARPLALWDNDACVHRFYYRYRSFVPLEVLGDDPGSNRREESPQLPRDVMEVEVWVQSPSPVLPFPDFSIVYLRGRMILLTPGAAPHDESAFILHVEVIFAHYRGCLQSPSLGSSTLWNSVIPEPTIIGRIVDVANGLGGWVTLLIETVDELSSGIVRMNVA